MKLELDIYNIILLKLSRYNILSEHLIFVYEILNKHIIDSKFKELKANENLIKYDSINFVVILKFRKNNFEYTLVDKKNKNSINIFYDERSSMLDIWEVLRNKKRAFNIKLSESCGILKYYSKTEYKRLLNLCKKNKTNISADILKFLYEIEEAKCSYYFNIQDSYYEILGKLSDMEKLKGKVLITYIDDSGIVKVL